MLALITGTVFYLHLRALRSCTGSRAGLRCWGWQNGKRTESVIVLLPDGTTGPLPKGNASADDDHVARTAGWSQQDVQRSQAAVSGGSRPPARGALVSSSASCGGRGAWSTDRLTSTVMALAPSLSPAHALPGGHSWYRLTVFIAANLLAAMAPRHALVLIAPRSPG